MFIDAIFEKKKKKKKKTLLGINEKRMQILKNYFIQSSNIKTQLQIYQQLEKQKFKLLKDYKTNTY